MERLRSIPELASLRGRILSSRDPNQPRITVCGGTGCRASGSFELFQAFSKGLSAHGLERAVELQLTGCHHLKRRVELQLSGCHGFCQQGPVVVIHPEEIFYRNVGLEDPEADANEIIEQTVLGGKPIERLLYEEPLSGRKIARYGDIPFYAKQTRIALGNNGRIDPNRIEDYIGADGYAALAKVLVMSPEEVLEWISRSGLRGRGGAGFPTGRKWSLCRAAPTRAMRYVICNADEGDPGAFMDRSLMEGDPHSVLEGMAIGAYAISRGVSPCEGYIYIRAEYPLAVENVRIAIRQAEEAGLLGDDILGTDFHFHVKVKEGAGAFVCGEETALIASIEGRRGMPQARPPFPADAGLFGQPSNINNVETWANVPRIVNHGPEWYAGVGTATSAGTKVFSLVGKIKNSGLVEVPMGMSLREIVFDIGGGIPGNKRIKAVQTGGPSGGCIPAHLLDLPVDYEKLAEAGAIMGSGGLVVMDEDTCMVDLARYFLDFTQNESCGKCLPCRLGTRQMLAILKDVCAGKGQPGDIDLLLDIGTDVKKGSLCGLGQTAPNPVLTTLRYFRDEYESHIQEGHCSALVCTGLVSAPCTHTCPAGVNVPRYVRLVAEGRFDDALGVVRESIPFPRVCGSVCFHPCETRCRRGQLDDPIAIRDLKEAAARLSTREFRVDRSPATGRRVAVVGSGPAGLTAAYHLSRLGHEVVVYEKMPLPGGMMRYGIPRFRLPDETLDAEVATVRDLGVTIRTDSPVESPEALLEEGYDALFLATGAWEGTRLGVPGEELPGVVQGVDFLREAAAGTKPGVAAKVAVIGGGNVAVDVARTALRLGSGGVSILYRRSREEMPASREEVEEALEEGVALRLLTSPVALRAVQGAVGLTSVRMELGPVDRSGRPRPQPLPGSEHEDVFDRVILAIGQAPGLPAGLACRVEEGRVRADRRTLAASAPGVFAGGDVYRGPASIIEAIADGKRVASAIDRYLGGRGEISEKFGPADEPVGRELAEDEPAQPRVPLRRCPVPLRLADGGLVSQGYGRAEAIAEARRCLRCDLEEKEE
jgi:NADH-quinone oxidoreductase subunit F